MTKRNQEKFNASKKNLTGRKFMCIEITIWKTFWTKTWLMHVWMDCYCLHSPTSISWGLRKVRPWRNRWSETIQKKKKKKKKNSCQNEQGISCKT